MTTDDTPRMTPALKRELCAMFQIPLEAFNPIDTWHDHQNQCTVYRQGDTLVRVTDHAMMQLSPMPDPFTEAFTVVALALHEARKRSTEPSLTSPVSEV